VTRGTTISEERFYEELAANFPTIEPLLKAFTARLQAIDVGIDFGKKSMILRWRPDEQHLWNLGIVDTSGRVVMEILNGQANAVGRLNLSHAYLKRLASLVPGAYVKQTPKPTGWYVGKGEKYIAVDEMLAHGDDCLAAIRE